MKNKKFNKDSRLLLIIFLLQGVIGFVILNTYMGEGIVNWHVSKSIPIIYAIINMLGIIGVKYVIDLLDKEVKYQKLLIELKKSDEVLVMLRAQKHDFNNHLQTIMGLAQINENQRIVSYIKNISNEVTQNYAIANISIPEIAVVLMQKLGEASHKGIKVGANIKTTCEGLRGEPIHYAQILFNLLDNAIFELNRIEDVEKVLEVDILEGKGYFEFIVYNNLPIIPEKTRVQVFERGFTTKQGDHDGLGLWNVQKLVHMNKGMIKVESDVGHGTVFSVIIPK